MVHPSYCVGGPSGQPNPRIKIFQRTLVKNLRAFVNLQEVIKLAELYTSKPVEVFTVNASTSIAEQVVF